MPISFGASNTLGDLVEEVVSNIQGFTAAPDQMTYLAADCTSSDTTLYVNDASNISRGLIEIGSELIWVQTVNTSTNTLTTLPKGRGWRGSTAAAHATNDTVVVSPVMPRYIAAREINNEIAALYPSIFGVKSTEFTLDSVIQLGWPLPTDAESVLDVRWKDFMGNWQRVRGWELEKASNTDDFPSGTALRITDSVPISRTVRVVYGTMPTTLTDESAQWSTTGLSNAAKDLVILGAMIRAIPMLDVSRLSVQYVPADELDQPRPIGSALGIVKDMRQTYQVRLMQERTILATRYPARIHRTR